MEYNPEPVEVIGFLKEIAEDAQRTFGHHKIVLQLTDDHTLMTDRARLSQVVNNLISNAVKYSPDAEKIIIKAHQEQDEFVFSIRDFGVGIPSEMHEQIFERFFRVSESEGNRVSGLGLGLYISAQIVRQLGGDISVKSKPGKGSTFFVRPPLNPKANIPVPHIS